VYQNLLLQLDTAQYALLRRDSVLFQGSLAEAGAWVQKYFDAAAPQTRSFVDRLEAAAATDVRPPMPDISASLRMLQRRRAEQQAAEADT
jgi:uroporphyrin-3 C-methyltransferase